ncbi:putative cytochrome c1 heme lyase [Cardiosporidium cionae]|uniref:Holocytochrome c-type synthase n=1 Tax=Cardiosporidium cionae TaxID=476202 RepID=A0ABQ7JFW2_9APIC|nr:putative cytochrome c1 heme lyase [Cardiosporidium cionae]|eukprot:KAF8822908.1 putative cytochrome c1 heme lyase [Cardiosporidium cionae]
MSCPFSNDADSSGAEFESRHADARTTACTTDTFEGAPGDSHSEYEKAAFFLSSEREKSTIPSVSGDWYYPSPKQFYKSILLKGHVVDPADIPTVVSIHNQVNEESWKRIIKFEKLHENVCKDPKLVRFLGRAGDLSLKAKIRSLVGFGKPFDRHDWFVDRCGERIKYIVDFYDGLPDPEKPISIFIDARPELTFSGMLDRAKLYFRQALSFWEKRE